MYIRKNALLQRLSDEDIDGASSKYDVVSKSDVRSNLLTQRSDTTVRSIVRCNYWATRWLDAEKLTMSVGLRLSIILFIHLSFSADKLSCPLYFCLARFAFLCLCRCSCVFMSFIRRSITRSNYANNVDRQARQLDPSTTAKARISDCSLKQ